MQPHDPLRHPAWMLLQNSAGKAAAKPSPNLLRELQNHTLPFGWYFSQILNPSVGRKHTKYNLTFKIKISYVGCLRTEDRECNVNKIINSFRLAWLQGGDVTTLRNILPEQILVDILAERFQVSYSLLFLFLVVINIMF